MSGVQFLLKKKINVKSSTEGEIIGVYEAMSKILCSRYSIEAQGYNVSYNKLMQYNNSAILLENNGKFSRSNKTKHIKAGYFFVMDRVAQGGLKILHCPEERMCANVFNNPLQGRACR